MAYRHDEITQAGARIVGISIDSPEQHSALIENLRLPFPMLSDPDREKAVRPYDVADEKDKRHLARPAVIVVGQDGEVAFGAVSRDYADRLPEDELIETLRGMNLPPTTQAPPQLGPAEPGPRAMPFEQLYTYFRGARFALVPLSRRRPDVRDETGPYMEQLDRYMDAVKRLFKEKRQG